MSRRGEEGAGEGRREQERGGGSRRGEEGAGEERREEETVSVREVEVGGTYVCAYVSDQTRHYLVSRCALKEAACDSTLPALCVQAHFSLPKMGDTPMMTEARALFTCGFWS